VLKKLPLYLNVIFAFVLLVAGFSKYVNPITSWIPAFFGITYPFLLLINILFLLGWFLFFKKKRLSLISLIAIVLTGSSFTSVINISAPERTIDEISILSWNVKNFDLYNWSNNKETHELMMQLLEEKDADVVCFQEFYTERTGTFKNIKEIKKRLGYKYYYFGETFNIKNNKKWGLATFSKFPIKDHGQIKFDKGSRLNSCIYTDIEYAKDSVFRIYNTHMQSLHFGVEDYEYLKELKDEKKANVESSIKIVKKIKNGFVKRAKQAHQILDHKNEFTGKSIICGDFNDTPTSYAYNLLSENMQDAFKEKGIGFGNTLMNPTPFFRIDFMLMDPSLKINSYKTYKKNYSDHYPIQVYFEN
jgi:endonuclease/exonuclease/phosphatase family metal-dependent hydrolase